MGAHKYNPVAIAAKNGELPPKPPKKSKRELEQELHGELTRIMFEKSPEAAALFSVLNRMPYFHM